ncbi:MAG: cytochrome bc complex cytochrome b subunit [Candidatus Marinimicrobia bacterium]|nr:cytochrome bc complex cytochrome b subunit [FCB group bacterium]MBL7024877.1 cytochrome bc complex cytochrome b subunit [Candidatus Neomarinimicrobiota bacterium]
MSALTWLEERFDIAAVTKFASKKQVPIFYGTIWYYLGGISLFLFIIQILTGMLLALYYQPGAETSFESLKFIVSKVEFGWLMREIHSWAANLFVLTIFMHMFTVFFSKAYRKPRELTWVTGMILLGLAMFFGFSGYLLPWNELAYFATKVGTDIAGAVPFIGDFLVKVLRAGDDVSGATLTRFYSIHTSILPLIFFVVLGVHLILIQVQGMSVPASIESTPPSKRKSMPFFPNFVVRDLVVWLIVLNIIALLAVFFPWELGLKADSLASAPAGIRPEWYFMFMFQTLKLLPSHVWLLEGEVFGILLFGLGGLVWLLIPFLERPKHSQLWSIFGIGMLAYMIVLTVWGYVV